MSEQKKKIQTFELPEYATDFRNLSAADQEMYYAKFDLKTSIERKLFSFLCQVIADAQLKTHRAVTSFKYYVDIVLKWASNPNNLRALQGFPRTEQTLKNNVHPLLQHLMSIGICRVMPSPDSPDESKYIALLPEARLGAPAAEKELETIAKFLGREYDSAADDPNYPLPVKAQVEAVLKRPLNRELTIELIQAEHCNRTTINDTKCQEAHLIQINFSGKYDLLLTPAQLPMLMEIAARRMVLTIRALPSLNVLDTFLKEKFPGESTLSMKKLLADVSTGEAPDFTGNCKVWSAIAFALLEEIKRVEKNDIVQKNKQIATYLTLSWISHDRNMELQVGLETALLKDLYEHIASQRRYITLEELRLRPKTQDHIKRHGEDTFNNIFTNFIQQHSIENNPDKAIIRLTGKTIGTSYIHSRNILPLFRSIPGNEREQVERIVLKNFVLPLSENLFCDEMRPQVKEWYGDDAKIEERLRAVLDDQFDFLTDLHSFIDMYDYFASNIQTVTFLCSKLHLPEGNFLLPDHRGNKLLRPLLAMLDCTGSEILRRAQKHVPLLRRILQTFKNFFRGNRDRLEKEQQLKKPTKKPAGKAPTSSSTKHVSAEKRPARSERRGPAPSSGGGKQKIPTGGKTVTPDALYSTLARGRDAEYYLGIWNRVLGPAAEENKRICHAIITKKVTAIELRIKNGENFINVEEQASYVAHAPRLGQIEKKDPLARYIELILLEELEKLRKTKKLRFEYITVDK